MVEGLVGLKIQQPDVVAATKLAAQARAAEDVNRLPGRIQADAA